MVFGAESLHITAVHLPCHYLPMRLWFGLVTPYLAGTHYILMSGGLGRGCVLPRVTVLSSPVATVVPLLLCPEDVTTVYHKKEVVQCKNNAVQL